MAVWQGEASLARRLLVESLRLFQGIPSRDGIGWCLHGLAGLAGQAALDEGRRAVRLLGAADTLTWTVTDWPPEPRAEYDRVVVAARAQIDTPGWEAAFAEGMAMTQEQAISYALEGTACS